MLNVCWVETSVEIYRAIYNRHREELTVFATCTESGPNHMGLPPLILTEWGFKEADAALIKSECRAGTNEYRIHHDPRDKWTYWLALVEQDTE